MDLMAALNWRYAVRKFSEQTIDEHRLRALLMATCQSASSYGLQPYRLLLVTSAEIRKQLLEHSLGQEKVAYSSHLLIFATQTNIGDDTVRQYVEQVMRVRQLSLGQLTNMSDHYRQALAIQTSAEKLIWAQQQTYIALGNFLTCAALMSIDTCPMTGINARGYDEILGLAAKQLTTTVVCPIGIRHPDDTSANLKKVRFDYDEMVVTY